MINIIVVAIVALEIGAVAHKVNKLLGLALDCTEKTFNKSNNSFMTDY